jgi:hypothetical protein
MPVLPPMIVGDEPRAAARAALDTALQEAAATGQVCVFAGGRGCTDTWCAPCPLELLISCALLCRPGPICVQQAVHFGAPGLGLEDKLLLMRLLGHVSGGVREL